MGLINETFIKSALTHSAKYLVGHGAEPESTNLGFGMVYYGLVHAFRCRCCIVLGSGGGFVPRILRQAQLDMGLQPSATYLVDADMGHWGRPDWTDPGSFFRSNWPDIHWIKRSTEQAVKVFAKGEVDFLHVDANHSRALQDFQLYEPLVRPGGIVTLHDVKIGSGCNARLAVEFIRELPGWDVINFDIGVGIGLAYKRPE